jgi:tetratricopeptide (TPR) repeat protein
MNERFKEAAAAAERAVGIFESWPALVADRADAVLVRAMSLHRMHLTTDALELVIGCLPVFGAHGQTRRYMTAYQVCGAILYDLEEYAVARDAYKVAHRVAGQLKDPREFARTLNNVGQCSVMLGDLEAGEQALQEAFPLFHSERMDAEIVHTVVGLARAARQRGKLREALYTFHSVYADLLHGRLEISAASVLVELGDIVMELTGDSTYARTECARLAETFGGYDVAGNVRDAMMYLREKTREEDSLQSLRAAFDHVRSFLRYLWSSPSTPFAAPA